MSVSILKELFRERDVTHVAIIDDVFDVPDPGRLSRERFERFVQTYNSNVELRKAMARAQPLADLSVTLPFFDDLSVRVLGPIWQCYWRSYLKYDRCHLLSMEHEEFLRDLFEEHADNVQEALDSVLNIFKFFKYDLGVSVSVYGNENQDFSRIAKTQIVIVDYFLVGGSDSEAYRRVREVIENVVGSARSAKIPIPLFLLVSARESAVDSERLREGCKLMKSRFEFVPKSSLRGNEVELMLRIYALVGAFEGMELMEKLFRNWRDGVDEATAYVHRKMLSLDVADLVSLNRFRLTHEGVSIGGYLRWFMTEYLSSIIDKRLDRSLWSSADGRDILGPISESGETLDVISSDSPSDAMFNAYSSIMFDNRGGDDAAPLLGSDLMEGDLFVCARSSAEAEYEGARVLLIITPSCDLVQRDREQPPSARNVLLLPGILRGILGTEREKDFSKDIMVRIEAKSHLKVFRIEWQFREPVTRPWRDVRARDVESGFEYLGRVRKLYFHRIRNDFTNILTRIGTEVVPTLPVSRGGRVEVRVGGRGRKASYRTVMCFSADARMLWEISPVRGVRGGSERLYQVSREFISTLRNRLDGLESDLVEGAREATMHLERLDMWIDLLRARKAGYRGKAKVIYIANTTGLSEFVQNRDTNAKGEVRIFPLMD